MSAQLNMYYIRKEDLENTDFICEYIYNNTKVNYYCSDDFSQEFYIKLAKLGFISTSIYYNDILYLLPEMQFEYALLDFKDLHISKKVKKLLKNDDYIFLENYSLEEVLEKINDFHKKDNWLRDKYKDLILELESYRGDDFKINSFELRHKETKELIAGEIGYSINNIYTSLTGFCSKEKKYNNYGKLQLVLLAQYLEKNNYKFWNLGHPYMQYKFDLGAKEYKRMDFLQRWFS